MKSKISKLILLSMGIVLSGCDDVGEFDSSRAFEDHQYALKFAERGIVKAQHIVASKYANGLGVNQDPIKAGYWYKQAAGQGYSSAQMALGAAYCNPATYDIDVPVDVKKGEEYLKTSFYDGGLASASILLAGCAKIRGDAFMTLAWYGVAQNLNLEHADQLLLLTSMTHPEVGGSFWQESAAITEKFLEAHPK